MAFGSASWIQPERHGGGTGRIVDVGLPGPGGITCLVLDSFQEFFHLHIAAAKLDAQVDGDAATADVLLGRSGLPACSLQDNAVFATRG